MNKLIATLMAASLLIPSVSHSAEPRIFTVKDLYEACTSKNKATRDMCASFLYGEMTVLMFNYDTDLKICLKNKQAPSLEEMPILFKLWADNNREVWDKHAVYSTHAFIQQWPCP